MSCIHKRRLNVVISLAAMRMQHIADRNIFISAEDLAKYAGRLLDVALKMLSELENTPMSFCCVYFDIRVGAWS